MGIDVSEYSEIREKFLNVEELKYLDELRNYKGKVLIGIKKFKTYKELRKSYLDVIYAVAGCVQNEIVDEEFNPSIRWNMYLVYVVDGTAEIIDYDLIEKIEKEDYCCKKYVFSAKDNTELNKQLETKLPILIDIFKESKPNLQGYSVEDESKKLKEDERLLKFPEKIENYLESNNLKIEEFLKEEMTLEKIKEVYGGE